MQAAATEQGPAGAAGAHKAVGAPPCKPRLMALRLVQGTPFRRLGPWAPARGLPVWARHAEGAALQAQRVRAEGHRSPAAAHWGRKGQVPAGEQEHAWEAVLGACQATFRHAGPAADRAHTLVPAVLVRIWYHSPAAAHACQGAQAGIFAWGHHSSRHAAAGTARPVPAARACPGAAHASEVAGGASLATQHACHGAAWVGVVGVGSSTCLQPAGAASAPLERSAPQAVAGKPPSLRAQLLPCCTRLQSAAGDHAAQHQSCNPPS